MTEYYVRIATSLVAELTGAYPGLPGGFRLVERWGPRGKHQETWLVSDDHAPREYEGHMVELSLSQDPEGNCAIFSREITDP